MGIGITFEDQYNPMGTSIPTMRNIVRGRRHNNMAMNSNIATNGSWRWLILLIPALSLQDPYNQQDRQQQPPQIPRTGRHPSNNHSRLGCLSWAIPVYKIHEMKIHGNERNS